MYYTRDTVTLVTVTHGGIDVSLQRSFDVWSPETGRGYYRVAVSDADGPLHEREFPYSTPDELTEANERAGDWFDSVIAVVEQYVDRPTSQNVRALIGTLLH